MTNITVKAKTNGYKISDQLQKAVDCWVDYLSASQLKIKYFDLFYYGKSLVMATCKLTDNCYGHFNITANRISFCGYECTTDEYMIFTHATLNDECFNGQLTI